MRKFLKKVATAKTLKAMNIESWVDAVERKLRDINVTTVSEIQKGIVTMNRKIDKNRASMLHIRTLNVMAQVAEEQVEEQLRQSHNEVTKLTNELITYRAEQDLKDANKTASKKMKKSPDETISTDEDWATVDQLDKSETLLLNMDDDVKSKDKIMDTTWLGDNHQVLKCPSL
jgi:hypothetical protein